MHLIKLIIMTYTSERDVNGNCYHAARVISTATRESAVFGNVGGENNMTGYARNAGLEWEEIFSAQIVLPKRQWKRVTDGWPYVPTDQIEAELKRLATVPAAPKVTFPAQYGLDTP